MERNLKYQKPYMQGEDVLLLQNQLLAAGFSPGVPDGIFGRKTQGAVIAFQADKGLEVDGIVGPLTREALLFCLTAEKEGDLLTDFLAYLNEQLGQIYVWGAQGQIVSAMPDPEGWIREKETSSKNAKRALSLYYSRKCMGRTPIRAYDCSGLIMYFLMERGIFSSDLSSRGLYAKCRALREEELKPGDLLFRHNGKKIHHVGVYAGDGEVIEAMGRDVGVVRRPLSNCGKNYWNRFGRLKKLEGAV